MRIKTRPLFANDDGIKSRNAIGVELVETSVADILASQALQHEVRRLLLADGLVLLLRHPRGDLTPEQEVAFMKLLPHDGQAKPEDVSGPYSTDGTGIVAEASTDKHHSRSSTAAKKVCAISRWKLPNFPTIQLQGSGRVSNHHGLEDGELVSHWETREWHADGLHDVPFPSLLPPVATSMYCLESPRGGGDTLFASGRRAFAAQPPQRQTQVLHMWAAYDAVFRPMAEDGTRAIEDSHQDQATNGPLKTQWPIAIRDLAGATSLYVGPSFTRHLEVHGPKCNDEKNSINFQETSPRRLTPSASQALLGSLLQCGLRDNVYRHEWMPGDFVVWNNRSVLHSATPSDCYRGERRMIHRIRMASQEPILAATSISSHPLVSYARLWAVQQFLGTGFAEQVFRILWLLRTKIVGDTEGEDSSLMTKADFSLASQCDFSWVWAFWALLLLVLWVPQNNSVLLVATVVNMIVHAAKLPMVWDYEFWDWFIELTVVLSIVHRIPSAAPQIARAQMITYYGSTVFWKLTSSFLNPKVSCAPIFILSLLDSVLPATFEAARLVAFLVKTSGPMTVLMEALVPTLLYFIPEAGVYLGLVFHFLIAVTPPPNNAGGFSVSVAVRYAFFVVDVDGWPSSFSSGIFGIAISAAALLGYERGRDWALPVYTAMALYLVGKLLSGRPQPKTSPRFFSTTQFPKKSLAVIALSTSLYTIGYPILGFDMGASTMFANLKVFAGTNHLLRVPTGLLLFDDEVLRIDNCTSSTINSIHPNEVTGLHSNRLTKWLRESGHTGRQFAPYAVRTIGSSMSFGDSFNGPYIIPAHELRRLVQEARAQNELFTLEYTKLGRPPLAGFDADWSKVFYDERTKLCRVETGNGSRYPCDQNEPPLSPSLPAWSKATQLYFSFPVAVSGSVNDETGCLC